MSHELTVRAVIESDHQNIFVHREGTAIVEGQRACTEYEITLRPLV